MKNHELEENRMISTPNNIYFEHIEIEFKNQIINKIPIL